MKPIIAILLFAFLPGWILGQTVTRNLRLTVRPSWSRVMLNDSAMRGGGYFLKVPSGEYRLQAWASKYEYLDTTFVVFPDSVRRFRVALPYSQDYLNYHKARRVQRHLLYRGIGGTLGAGALTTLGVMMSLNYSHWRQEILAEATQTKANYWNAINQSDIEKYEAHLSELKTTFLENRRHFIWKAIPVGLAFGGICYFSLRSYWKWGGREHLEFKETPRLSFWLFPVPGAQGNFGFTVNF